MLLLRVNCSRKLQSPRLIIIIITVIIVVVVDDIDHRLTVCFVFAKVFWSTALAARLGRPLLPINKIITVIRRYNNNNNVIIYQST